MSGSGYCRFAEQVCVLQGSAAADVFYAVHIRHGVGGIRLADSPALGVKNLPGWFTKSNSALAGIIVMSIWHDAGYYMIIFLSALQGLSKEVYESARVDGANGLQTFFRITVPMMASNILFVSILATMNSFKVFDQINVLTEGGPGYSTNVLVYCIYHYAFREHNIGYASAVAVLLFLIIVIISAVQVKLKEKYTI